MVGHVKEKYDYIFKILLVISISSIFLGRFGSVSILGRALFVNFADIIIPICFIMVLFLVLFSNEKFLLGKGLFIYLLLIIYIYMSSFWAIDQLKVLRGGLTFSVALLLYLLIINAIKKDEDIISSVTLLRNIGFVLAIIVLFLFFHNRDLLYSDFYLYKRALVLPLGGSNYLASFLAFFLFIIISFPAKQKAIQLFYIIIVLLSILLIGSKGALIAIFVCILLFCLRYNKYTMLCGLFLLVAFLVYMYTNPLGNELPNGMLRIWERGTAVKRFILMNIGWDIFKNNPILGVGLYNMQLVFPQFYITETEIHNGIIQLISELGLVGSLIYLMLYAYGARLWKKIPIIANKRYFGFVLGIFVMLLHSNLEIILLTTSYEYLLAMVLGFLSFEVTKVKG